MTIGPDQLQLESDMRTQAFVGGLSKKAWRVVSLQWPHLLVAVRARDDREFAFWLECRNYPQSAPRGELWDLENNCLLDESKWPRSGNAFRPEVKSSVANGIYMGCDRLGLQYGNQGWINSSPNQVWTPERKINFYLEQVHAKLNCSGYSPPQNP